MYVCTQRQFQFPTARGQINSLFFPQHFFHTFRAKHKDIIMLLFLFLTPDDKNSLMKTISKTLKTLKNNFN